MPGRSKALELEDERTAQRAYARLLRDRPSLMSAYQGPRNSLWTGNGLPAPKKVLEGKLFGRVALVRPDADGCSEFYIGETFADLNGIDVYSWTTPIACTFFRGKDHHDLCEDVGVVRAFRCEGAEIVDFADETLRTDAPKEPFAKRGLSIPAPPRRSIPPIPKQGVTTLDSVADGEESSSARGDQSAASGGVAIVAPAIRAESLLRAQMEAPRTNRLSPVLSTLQPDQYELVTRPAMDSVVIEGQPGTGKTIIASHRAAYLVNEDTPAENGLDGNVLVVGPTNGYSRHIRDVINKLAGETDRIRVVSLPELMSQILGVQQPTRGHKSHTWQDGAWELVTFARSAIEKLKTANGTVPQLESVYEYLRSNGGTLAKGRDPEWSLYLRQLPPFKEAMASRVHPPLLAFIKWEIDKPTGLDSVEHIIVDEAQDVTPLEWFLLDVINEADAWTILGDPNQRRSDHTLASWDQVLDVIAIDPDTQIRTVKRAYRSTRPILEYANRLLPRDQRKVDAFQGAGPKPTVTRTRTKDLGAVLLSEINRLTDAYPTGTVAVIAEDTKAATLALRGQGWRTDSFDSLQWMKNDRAVTVAVADEARGLEFDAVVVIEPGQFPKNFGRRGPLYTALTRANRELAVVHVDPLPNDLRVR